MGLESRAKRVIGVKGTNGERKGIPDKRCSILKGATSICRVNTRDNELIVVR